MSSHLRTALLGLGALLVAGVLAFTILSRDETGSRSIAAADASTCDKFASPTGSDSQGGTSASPYRHLAKLIASVPPGGTGCLTSGATFDESMGYGIIKTSQGTTAEPVTIHSTNPAQPAEVQGPLELQPAAPNVIFDGVDFTGSKGALKTSMLAINASGIEIRHSEVTFPQGICMSVGRAGQDDAPGGPSDLRVSGFVIDHSRVHDCGSAPAVDAIFRTDYEEGHRDSGVHGVYLVNAQSPEVTDNYIYDVVDRGIQLYPDVDGATIANNVLDGNGSALHISTRSDHGRLSENNVVENNVITNSDLYANDPSRPYWPQGDTDQVYGFGFPNDGNAYGNIVRGNCLYGSPGAHNFGGYGYSVTGNILQDPGYADRAAKDFTLRPGGPCAGKGPRTEEIPPPPGETCGPDPVTVPGATDGPDQLTGGDGSDVFRGLGGDDTLAGGGGNDSLCGDEGNDLLRPGTGLNLVHGGDGVDRIDYSDVTEGAWINLGDQGTVRPADGHTIVDDFTSIENATGTPADDRIDGSPEEENHLSGGAGDDVLDGGTRPTQSGERGTYDYLDGGPGSDHLIGAVGNGTAEFPGGGNAEYADAPEGIAADLSAGRVTVGRDTDVLTRIHDVTGSPNADRVVGEEFENWLAGGSGDDVIDGAGAGDLLVGGTGADKLAGGAGADKLLGGDGDDAIDSRDADGTVDRQIDCGPGNDTLLADGGDESVNCEHVNEGDVPVAQVPDTRITGKPPAKVFTRTSAQVRFLFAASSSPATFDCRVRTGDPWASCSSPKTFRLRPGSYVFSVRGRNAAGVDQSPASTPLRVVKRR